jgi:hypothetical protein
MQRRRIDKVEFYITNVCNLTCNRCNRFNNFNFKGWQRWSDYESAYQAWSDYLDIDKIVVLGGEPLLNPTLIDWIHGLNRIWRRPVQILSNGTRLNAIKGLLQVLDQEQAFLGISWHNMDELDTLRDIVRKFLGEDYEEVHGKLNNFFGADFVFRSPVYSIIIPVWIQNEFTNSAIRPDRSLHNNDPVEAHSACSFAKFKNYHFIRGKLYKCGPMGVLPEFDQQLGLNISDADRELLLSYRPLSVDEIDARAENFFATLDDPLPQCKFCPVDKTIEIIKPITKYSQYRIQIAL